MQQISGEKISEAFEKAPPELIQAMASIDIDAKLAELQKKHLLHLDVVDALDARISWLLLGIIKADEFNDSVKTIEGFPKERMDAVIKDINELILGPIRGKYMELERLSAQIEEPAEEGATVPAPEEKKVSAEEVLKASGIEVVTQEVPKMTEEKLSAPFRLPKQETDLSINKSAKTAIEERPEELPSPGIMAPNPSPAVSGSTAPSPAKIDPYREKPL